MSPDTEAEPRTSINLTFATPIPGGELLQQVLAALPDRLTRLIEGTHAHGFELVEADPPVVYVVLTPNVAGITAITDDLEDAERIASAACGRLCELPVLADYRRPAETETADV